MTAKAKRGESKALVRAKKKSLLESRRGGTEFIEKIILIGLFALVAAVGVIYISQKVTKKFVDQGTTIESDVHSEIPSGSSSP